MIVLPVAIWIFIRNSQVMKIWGKRGGRGVGKHAGHQEGDGTFHLVLKSQSGKGLLRGRQGDLILE